MAASPPLTLAVPMSAAVLMPVALPVPVATLSVTMAVAVADPAPSATAVPVAVAGPAPSTAAVPVAVAGALALVLGRMKSTPALAPLALAAGLRSCCLTPASAMLWTAVAPWFVALVLEVVRPLVEGVDLGGSANRFQEFDSFPVTSGMCLHD